MFKSSACFVCDSQQVRSRENKAQIYHTPFIFLLLKDCSIQIYEHSKFGGICSKSKVRYVPF